MQPDSRIVARVDRFMSICDKLEAGFIHSHADSEKLMETVYANAARFILLPGGNGR